MMAWYFVEESFKSLLSPLGCLFTGSALFFVAAMDFFRWLVA